MDLEIDRNAYGRQTDSFEKPDITSTMFHEYFIKKVYQLCAGERS